MLQAEDRIHRIGQKNAANIYYLVAKDTVEQRLLQIIQKKSAVFTTAIDGGDAPKNFNIFDLLCKALLKAPQIISK